MTIIRAQLMALVFCVGCGLDGGNSPSSDSPSPQSSDLAAATPTLSSVALSPTGTLTFSGSNLAAVTRVGVFGGRLGGVPKIGLRRTQFDGTAENPFPLAFAPSKATGGVEVGSFAKAPIRFVSGTKYSFVVGNATSWSAPLDVTFTLPSQPPLSGTVAVQTMPDPGASEWNGHNWHWVNQRQANKDYAAGGVERVLNPLTNRIN